MDIFHAVKIGYYFSLYTVSHFSRKLELNLLKIFFMQKNEKKKIFTAIHTNDIMGLPGFEPGLEDSESSVLAITPQARMSLCEPLYG